MLQWAELDFWDLWKAVSVALTGMFGILGLLADFKDPISGRITFWGKINLAGIIVSATMGVFSQLVDSQRQAEAARSAANEAASSANLARETADRAGQTLETTRGLVDGLVQVSRETRTIAQGTERSVANSRDAAEAGRRTATATLDVAQRTDMAVNASQAGLDRIERVLSPFNEPVLVLTVSKSGVPPDQPACPAENKEAVLLVHVAPLDSPIQDFDISYRGEGRVRRLSSRAPRCFFDVRVPLEVKENEGRLNSYLDLPGKFIIIKVSGFDLAKEDLGEIKITTGNGQSLSIPISEVDVRRYRGGFYGDFVLYYQFPAGRDPRAKP